MLEGYTYVVDMDLSKFFDRVNHDRLMSRLATKIKDKRVLKLIRSYLRSGVMVEGVTILNKEGTPQGGPLSPLLSNIVLDELDKELEKRGHKFVRYADDFMIYCKSLKAAERVKLSITRFLTVKLKLKVYEERSDISRLWLRKYLWFTYFRMFGQSKIRIHAKSMKRLKDKVRMLTSLRHGKSLRQVIEDLNQYFRGWWNYFRLTSSQILPQRAENMDNEKTTQSHMETVEESQSQGSKSKETWNRAQRRNALRQCSKEILAYEQDQMGSHRHA